MRLPNEELIKRGIVGQLVQDETIESNNIRIKVSGSSVTLDGIVKSYSEKISASEDASRVLGVKNVEN